MRPTHPTSPIKPMPGRDARNRVRVSFKGRTMMPFRATRIATMEPLVRRANAKRMEIPQAAEWLCISESCLRQWIAILGIRWKRGRNRTVYKHDRTGWDDRIVEGLRAGLTMEKIGRQLGVGHWMISRYAKQQGLWAVALNMEPGSK